MARLVEKDVSQQNGHLRLGTRSIAREPAHSMMIALGAISQKCVNPHCVQVLALFFMKGYPQMFSARGPDPRRFALRDLCYAC